MTKILKICEGDAYLFENADYNEGIEIAKKLPFGEFEITWNATERWWKEN